MEPLLAAATTPLYDLKTISLVNVAEIVSSPQDTLSLTWLIHLRELESALQGSSVLLPGTCDYENSVFIGNLLYRMQTPCAVVQVVSIPDVQATVRFARRYNYVLTIKNGGHSYAGYCLNRGGIVLDLSKMNRVTVDEDAMQVTLQAGALWKDAYKLLQDKEYYDDIIIGGQCPTVGVSGFTLGGGLSPFSRSYGLGCDNVLEMSVVTATGDLVTVSKDSSTQAERDLFWALCGGGGGNFGVTVEFKSQLHKLKDQPNGRVCCGELGWDLDNPEQERDFMAMMKTFNTMTIPDELTVDAFWNYQNDRLQGWMTVLYNGNEETYKQVLAPILAHKPTLDTVKEMQWYEWAVFSEGFDKKSMVYHHHSSFIFAEGAMSQELTSHIVSLMREAKEIMRSHVDPQLPLPEPGQAQFLHPPKSSVHILWDHIGGATARKSSSDNAFPWRTGAYVTNVKLQWTQESQAPKMYEFAQKCKRVLSPHAIEGKAAYLNYIDDTLGNWQEAYYGENHARLQQIKKHWDPDQFWRFDRAIEPESSVRHDYEREVSPTAEYHVPRRWTDLAVREPETLTSAKSPVEVLQLQEGLRRQSLI